MSLVRLSVGWHRIGLLVGAVTIVAAAPAIAGCNSGDMASSARLSSAACQATGTGTDALAVGGSAEATAAGSTAIGISADATASWSSSLGSFSDAKGQFATALGSFAGADAAVNGATAVGANAGKGGAGVFSTAIGAGLDFETSSRASGGNSIAIGGSDDDSIPGARANGFRSIAIGQKSVSADFGTSLGFNTKTVFASTAIGTDARATADSSTALGRFAKASANAALALGDGAVASKPRSVALGSGSLADAADTVSVGTNNARRRIVNVAPGASNSDAATLGQVKNIAAAAAVETAMLGAGENADIRRELAELRALVRQQQQELAQLKGQQATALNR
jgi:autotransporter adhesin